MPDMKKSQFIVNIWRYLGIRTSLIYRVATLSMTFSDLRSIFQLV